MLSDAGEVVRPDHAGLRTKLWTSVLTLRAECKTPHEAFKQGRGGCWYRIRQLIVQVRDRTVHPGGWKRRWEKSDVFPVSLMLTKPVLRHLPVIACVDGKLVLCSTQNLRPLPTPTSG